MVHLTRNLSSTGSIILRLTARCLGCLLTTSGHTQTLLFSERLQFKRHSYDGNKSNITKDKLIFLLPKAGLILWDCGRYHLVLIKMSQIILLLLLWSSVFLVATSDHSKEPTDSADSTTSSPDDYSDTSFSRSLFLEILTRISIVKLQKYHLLFDVSLHHH